MNCCQHCQHCHERSTRAAASAAPHPRRPPRTPSCRADCIFNGWNGFESPIAIFYQATANLVNAVFRNMRLTAELADVSYGSTVRFENARFANVSLATGKVVATTSSDFKSNIGDARLEHIPADDAAYDVEVSEVDVRDRGIWGADYVVVEGMMSDCMFMGYARNVSIPGCPEAAREARQRMFDLWAMEEFGSADGGGGAAAVRAAAYWYEYDTNDPNDTIDEDLVDESTPWFAETLKV